MSMFTTFGKTAKTLACAGTLLALAAPMTATAGSTPATLISTIAVDESTNSFYVTTDAAINNSPSCSTRGRRMALSNEAASAKMQLATLLTALNAKKRVRLVGTNRCDGSGSEILRVVTIYK